MNPATVFIVFPFNPPIIAASIVYGLLPYRESMIYHAIFFDVPLPLMYPLSTSILISSSPHLPSFCMYFWKQIRIFSKQPGLDYLRAVGQSTDYAACKSPVSTNPVNYSKAAIFVLIAFDLILCSRGRSTGALSEGGGPSSGNSEILKFPFPIGF